MKRALAMPTLEISPGSSSWPAWVCVHAQDFLPLRERLIAVFGETEGAKMSAKGVASIEKITTELIRTRPDLSRVRAD